MAALGVGRRAALRLEWDVEALAPDGVRRDVLAALDEVELEVYVPLMSRTLSLLEFRRNAKRALDAVRRGERLVLTYRGRPVARLEPVRPETDAVSNDEPFLRIEEFAVDGPGGRLANRDIDRLVYGP